jgi:hypothetical protein
LESGGWGELGTSAGLERRRDSYKDPDEALIEKMVEIAEKLGATVQGDDSEVYPGGHQPPHQVPQSVKERLQATLESWVWKLRYLRDWRERKRRMDLLTVTFFPGQRVKDVYGREAVVIAVTAGAPSGLGKISIRYENGKEVHFALVASGLTPLTSEKASNSPRPSQRS